MLAEAGIVEGVSAGLDLALIVYLQRNWEQGIKLVSILKARGPRWGRMVIA